MRVAILDDSGLLIGSRISDEGVECGDLPTNGSYRYADGAFIPVGHGKGKPARPEVSPYTALKLLIRAVDNGAPVPDEALKWAEWHDQWGGK